MSQNLLVNPGFEIASPSTSGFSSVTIPGWTVTGTPTVIPYGTPLTYPSPTAVPFPTVPNSWAWASPVPRPRAAATTSPAADPWPRPAISQTVNLTAASAKINTGSTPYTLSGMLGGYLTDPSATSVQVTFLNASGVRSGHRLDRRRSRRWIAWESPGSSHATSPGRSRWAPPPRW